MIAKSPWSSPLVSDVDMKSDMLPLALDSRTPHLDRQILKMSRVCSRLMSMVDLMNDNDEMLDESDNSADDDDEGVEESNIFYPLGLHIGLIWSWEKYFSRLSISQIV